MERTPKQPIDRGAPASVVADKFGGLSGLAKAINKAPGTVHRWLVKGHIDGQYHEHILNASALYKKGVKPIDFVDTRKPEEKARPGSAPAEVAA